MPFALYLLMSVFLSFFFLDNDPWLPIILAMVSFLKLNFVFLSLNFKLKAKIRFDPIDSSLAVWCIRIRRWGLTNVFLLGFPHKNR